MKNIFACLAGATAMLFFSVPTLAEDGVVLAQTEQPAAATTAVPQSAASGEGMGMMGMGMMGMKGKTGGKPMMGPA